MNEREEGDGPRIVYTLRLGSDSINEMSPYKIVGLA